MIKLTGTLTGTARRHTPETLAATWQKAFLVLPDGRGGILETTPDAVTVVGKFPTVLFCHGSSGVNDAIKTFGRWLARTMKAAFVVPDAMQLPDRLMYTSPIAREDYEIIHALRGQELANAVKELAAAPWFDGRFVIVGTSEGGVTAARFDRTASTVKEAGRMIFSWSCEDNYHVVHHDAKIPDDLPVLNVMSLTDKFFSPANPYLDNPTAKGFAADVLKGNTVSSIVLIPGAPHALLNLPQTQGAVTAFLKRLGF